MARFDTGILGTPIGKLGNTVFRRMNGKIFVSCRPESYSVSMTQKAVNSREAFAAVVKFAKLITSFPLLSLCWKKANINGTSSYHRIIKYNLPLTKDGKLCIKNKIIPDGIGHRFNCELTENLDLIVNMENIDADSNYFAVNYYFFLILTNQRSKKSKTEFLVHTDTMEILNNSKEVNIFITLPENEKKLITKFRNLLILSAFILTKNKNTFIHSSTLSKEFLLDKYFNDTAQMAGGKRIKKI